jgi:hypothetical protein
VQEERQDAKDAKPIKVKINFSFNSWRPWRLGVPSSGAFQEDLGTG